MNLTKEQYYTAFVDSGGISKEDFEKTVNEATSDAKSIYDVVTEKSFLTDLQAAQLLAEYFNVGFVDLNQIKIDKKVIGRIPESFAKARQVIPLLEDDDLVKIATSDPGNVLLRSALEKYLRKQVLFVFASPNDIANNIRLFEEDVSTVFSRILERRESEPDLGKIVVELVDVLIERAHNAHASDIHIEPEDQETLIRYRIDGLLHDIARIPKDVHDNVVTRIKVLARIATDEHRAAQDGKIDFKDRDSGEVEIRVSIVPTTNGEKIVMRLLSAATRSFRLEELGMSKKDYDVFRDSIERPWGMILVTGPTGSGKTTTLYSALKVLNTREVNISTIEDPVEYDMQGVNQIQVNPKTNLTFASGLRSIVRQDPDIIMVGEIRDTETAGIGINAALTGHLVLSTLHTNNAATAFPRLQDMDVEDFLIASTVISVIAQRLVRQICSKCIYSHSPTEQELAAIEHLEDVKKAFENAEQRVDLKKMLLFKGKGCEVCQNTGYLGRIGIFETLMVTDSVREGIMAGNNADQLQELAVKEGMKTMLQDGINKVLQGVTTLEEVLRVTR